MSRFRNAVVVLAVAALLAGCSQGEPKAAPELPARICWGAFSGPEVNRLLAPAEKVSHTARHFAPADAGDETSCAVYADRATSFLAGAELLGSEGDAERELWRYPDALPLDVGRGGSVRNGGATTYFACRPAASLTGSGKYLALDIDFTGVPDEAKAQDALPGLLKDFMAFAERELDCA
ncbi:hypothetical protein AB0M64_24080 [Streptomyces sp. NPDC051771]|uniref:hypothetical protein n=1 Tax=Streptomyces sp. NPDC051771 TaxID=3154847 RepID=UPI00341BE4A4